ncbi:hypothetical protein H0H92_000436 [Tricholoma furcatifolium]|nr:hypothetical protein H0H92_000436 [Tricholoma furcatifolium]
MPPTPRPPATQACPLTTLVAEQHIRQLIEFEGTAPFMSGHLLMNPSARHCVGYDLESLYYVLVYVVTQLDHFDQSKFHKSKLPEPVAMWFLRGQTLMQLGYVKTSQFHLFLDDTLKHIKPQFSPLKPMLKRMWNALYPAPKSASGPPKDCCDIFIDAIEDEIFAAEGMAPNSTTSSSKKQRTS